MCLDAMIALLTEERAVGQVQVLLRHLLQNVAEIDGGGLGVYPNPFVSLGTRRSMRPILMCLWSMYLRLARITSPTLAKFTHHGQLNRQSVVK